MFYYTNAIESKFVSFQN